MSPQVHLIYPPFTQKTQPAYDQDKLPIWQETFNFELSHSSISLIAYHVPAVLNNVEIGRCSVDIKQGCGWFDIFKDFHKIGALKICFQFEFGRQNIEKIQTTWGKILNEVRLEKENVFKHKKKYKEKLRNIRDQKSVEKVSLETGEDTLRSFSIVRTAETELRSLRLISQDLCEKDRELIIQKEKIEGILSSLKDEWRDLCKRKEEMQNIRRKIAKEKEKISLESFKFNQRKVEI